MHALLHHQKGFVVLIIYDNYIALQGIVSYNFIKPYCFKHSTNMSTLCKENLSRILCVKMYIWNVYLNSYSKLHDFGNIHIQGMDIDRLM